MTKRNSTPSLADLETAQDQLPGPIPPLGTPADVTVKYRTNMDPASVPAQARQYSQDLRELAGEELDNIEPPLDALSAFCEQWSEYTGYQLTVVRHPDPAMRRMPGQSYNRPCFEIENLGNIPFDPNNLVYDLQMVNGNSGGAFKLFLRDNSNQIIRESWLERIVIPDPPRDHNQQRRRREHDEYIDRTPRYAEPPPPPVKSETEIMVEAAQRELFTTALHRALNPPAPPPLPDPVSQLSAEDQLAYSLLKQSNTNVLQTVVEKIAAITQQPDRIDPTPTWKDKLTDAGIQLVTQNPAVVAQATDIVTRAVTGILALFAPRTADIINAPLPAATPPPVRQPQAQRAQAAIVAGPTQPQPQPATNQTDTFNDDDPELIMVEEITKLLLDTEPLRLDHPIILDLRDAYPVQFQAALAAIAGYPSTTVITYLCQISEFAASMFNSPVTGPHLRSRLEELKALLIAPAPATPQPDSTPQTNDETQETEETSPA